MISDGIWQPVSYMKLLAKVHLPIISGQAYGGTEKMQELVELVPGIRKLV